MKPTVKRCGCGRVSNPVQLNIVSDAWVKNGVAYFDFLCPQCIKKSNIKMIWDERLIINEHHNSSHRGNILD